MNKRELRRLCQPHLYQEVVVRDIIEEQLAKGECVSEYSVIQKLQCRIHGPHLFNAAIAAGVDTDNGQANLLAGAQQVLEHTLPRLTEYRRDGAKILRQ